MNLKTLLHEHCAKCAGHHAGLALRHAKIAKAHTAIATGHADQTVAQGHRDLAEHHEAIADHHEAHRKHFQDLHEALAVASDADTLDNHEGETRNMQHAFGPLDLLKAARLLPAD